MDLYTINTEFDKTDPIKPLLYQMNKWIFLCVASCGNIATEKKKEYILLIIWPKNGNFFQKCTEKPLTAWTEIRNNAQLLLWNEISSSIFVKKSFGGECKLTFSQLHFVYILTWSIPFKSLL